MRVGFFDREEREREFTTSAQNSIRCEEENAGGFRFDLAREKKKRNTNDRDEKSKKEARRWKNSLFSYLENTRFRRFPKKPPRYPRPNTPSRTPATRVKAPIPIAKRRGRLRLFAGDCAGRWRRARRCHRWGRGCRRRLRCCRCSSSDASLSSLLSLAFGAILSSSLSGLRAQKRVGKQKTLNI